MLAAVVLSAATVAAQSDPTAISPGFALTPQANYGTSVALTDQVLVAGAPGQSFGGVETGGVTVARWNGLSWDSTSLPVPSSVLAGARFGQSVAIDRFGLYVAVGAPANSNAGLALSGSVYVFRWNQSLPVPAWELDLEGHGIFEGGFFGQSVAITQDYLAVGEPGALFFAGTVNVYQRISAFNWTNVAFYLGQNFFDAFGTSVELAKFGSRTDLFVGAPLNDGAAFDAGRVYNYNDSSGWQFIQSKDGSQAEEQFGFSLDARANNIVVGGPGYDATANNVGSVSYYVLEGALIFGTRLVGLTAGEGLGGSVAYLQNTAAGFDVSVIGGAPAASVNGADAGLVRAGQDLLTSSTTPVLTSWTAPGVMPGERHGFSVATVEGVQSSSYRVAVGVPFDGASGAGTGSVTVYRLTAPGSGTNLGFGLAGTGGMTPVLTATGAFEPGTQVQLDLANALPNVPYTLVVGLTQINLALLGGTLVPNPNLLLKLPTGSGGSAQLKALVPPNIGTYSLFFQAWGPDPGGPQGFAASNAVSISGS